MFASIAYECAHVLEKYLTKKEPLKNQTFDHRK